MEEEEEEESEEKEEEEDNNRVCYIHRVIPIFIQTPPTEDRLFKLTPWTKS